MPSNLDKFHMMLCRHFTAVELCEILDITIEDFVDAFMEQINDNEYELKELMK